MQTFYTTPVVGTLLNTSGSAVLGIPEFNSNLANATTAAELVIDAYFWLATN